VSQAQHMLPGKEHMSKRRLNDDGFTVTERVPDAVIEQFGIIAGEQPAQTDRIVRAIYGVDQLRHLDFQGSDDVRRDRAHQRIVAVGHPTSKLAGGVGSC
jgi:hypothetical protein